MKSPEAPSWDVDLTVPLGADTIRVDDIVARTGTLSGENVVAYSTTTSLPATNVGDALTLDAFTVPTVTAHLDTFAVSVPVELGTILQLSAIAPINLEGQSGSIPIPAFSFSSNPPSQVLTGIQAAEVVGASLQLSLTNKLGLPIDQLQVQVIDVWTNGVVFTWTPSGSVPANGTITSTVALPQSPASSAHIGTELGVSVQGHTPGGVVTIGTNQIEVAGQFVGDVRVTSATAPVPAQTIDRSFVSSFSSDANLTAAHFRSGSMQLTFDNDSAIPVSVALTIPQLVRSGSPVTAQISVPAHGSTQHTIDLAGSDYASSGSNVLAVDAAVTTQATAGAVTVNSTDALRVTTTGSNLALDTMTGIVDPRTITLSSTTHSLDIPSGVHEVGLRHAHARLSITNHIGVPMNVSLFVTAHGRDGSTRTLAQPASGIGPVQITLQPNTDAIVDFTETNSNLLDLVNLLPQSIDVSGTATVGDGTTLATIARTDNVSAELTLDVPFTMNLASPVNVEGEVSSVTLSADTREQIEKRVRALRLIADVENTLPIGADVTVVLANTPQGASDSVAVAGQSVVLHGTVTASTGSAHTAGQSTIDVSVDEADIPVFTSASMYVGTFARVHATAGEVSAFRSDRLIVRPRVVARAHIAQ